MKGFMKWVLMGGGVCLVLIVGAVVLIPRFVDVQQYKPMIEELVTEQTGRSFSMGDDIQLSVFPWVGVNLSDLRLGSPKGFENQDMIAVKRFEARLRVMPLLFRRIEVSTFVVDTPRFFLEKAKNGKANWENIGPGATSGEKKTPEKKASGKQDDAVGTSDGKLPIESFFVGKFSIVNGLVTYVDKKTGVKKEISDFNLDLIDISLDKPIGVKLSAKLDGKPISLEGLAGPVGKEPGKEDLNLDMTLKALEELSIHLKGKIVNSTGAPQIAMDLNVDPFSPRKLVAALGQPFPVKTADPKALDRVSLKVRIEGNAKAISLSKGVLGLDDSNFTFLAGAKAFDKPDIRFDMVLDSIDLDRYLPPKQEGVSQQGTEQKSAAKKTDQQKRTGQQKKTDYGPLRKLVLDGKIKVGSLKAANVKIQDFLAHITAKKGVIDLDPLSLNLYQGSVASKVRLDVSRSNPKTQITLDSKGIQAGPLLKDALEKEIIEGILAANMTLSMTGESPDMIKKSLSGKGELKFVDGAIVGIDIANTARNAAAGLGMGEKTAAKPRTDFAELKISFVADQGIVNIPGANIISPLIRLSAMGDANLVTEALDFRVEPKVVATLKGQGDTQHRSGLMVPLLITGSFDSPKIRPDLKAMVGGKIPDSEGIKQMLNIKGAEGSGGESIEDKAKGMLKGFMPNLKN